MTFCRPLFRCPFQTGHRLEGENAKTETHEGPARRSHSHFKHTGSFTWILLWMEAEVGVVAGCRSRLMSVAGGVGFERPGDSRDVGQVGRRARQRRRPTLQQELPVVDNSGTCRRRKRTLAV